MMVPHCVGCGERDRPLRWRKLFGAWICGPCEDRRVVFIVNELILKLIV